MAYRGASEASADRLRGRTAAQSAAEAPLVSRPRPDNRRRDRRRRHYPRLPRCPEIDCLRGLLPEAVLARAELEALETDVGADRVLIASGTISEEAYVTALAASLNIPFEPLSNASDGRCGPDRSRLLEAARTGVLRIADGHGDGLVVAPTNNRALVQLAKSGSDIMRRVRLTTSARLKDFAARNAADYIQDYAANNFRRRYPEFSAHAQNRSLMVIVCGLTAALAAGAILSHQVHAAAGYALGLIFLAWSGLRLLGLQRERPPTQQPARAADSELPIYTVIVALYREAAAIDGLIGSLRQLDYPAAKLDIKLVLESDDGETHDAIARLRPGPPFEVVTVPPGGPRTKPNALNTALLFARGSYVAVYDAEDRPDPDQLRRALDAFDEGGERLACVQARLTIDNASDNWLTGMFAAEYAGLFDVFLPGLARWRLPLPLGGSSNHFRTEMFNCVSAWDPYNVTEDADLGMRLARFGYHTTIIASNTYEEAPVRFRQWLSQRTRWFKGWVQTWLAHMRTPTRLFRELGPRDFLTFQLVIGGTVLAALIHPLFALQLVSDLATTPLADLLASPSFSFHFTMLFYGYTISATLGLVGLARREMLKYAWVLIFIPIYWLMLSLAAWRALYQLLTDPHRWGKTEHGLARTSRLAEGHHR
jgi:cellulose synthase/poly-beta-1,6-N-acetylglucosamine synthase-like glycosyltransferase